MARSRIRDQRAPKFPDSAKLHPGYGGSFLDRSHAPAWECSLGRSSVPICKSYTAARLISDVVMREKLDYIHQNPVKRGYVDLPEHWRYSSARNYLGQSGLIGIDSWG
jgi:hypothetical protein